MKSQVFMERSTVIEINSGNSCYMTTAILRHKLLHDRSCLNAQAVQ